MLALSCLKFGHVAGIRYKKLLFAWVPGHACFHYLIEIIARVSAKGGGDSNYFYVNLSPSVQGIDTSKLTLLTRVCLKDGLIHSDGKSHTCLEDIASIPETEPQFAVVSSVIIIYLLAILH